MGRLLKLIAVLFVSGALMAPSNAAAEPAPADTANAGAAAPAADADAGTSAPAAPKDELVMNQLVQGCIQACTDEMIASVGPGKPSPCVTSSQFETCLTSNLACAGSWDSPSLKALVSSCTTFGERMCGCGSEAEKSAPAAATAKPRVRSKSALTRALTPEEDCRKRGGAWVTVQEPKLKDDGSESGETVSVQKCVHLADLWMELQTLKDRLAKAEQKGVPLSEEELASLKALASTKAEGPVKGEIDDVLKAVKALCRAGSTTATAESTGSGASLSVQCDILRTTIAQADARSRQALDRANEAYEKADEADKKADRALNANRSNLRVVGTIGVYAKRTPDYGPAIKGDTTIVYAGGGMGWTPCFRSGVCLALDGVIGSSITPIFGSRSFTVKAGAGLGTHVADGIFVGGEAFYQHFVWPNEWSKLNVYGVQPVGVFTLAQLGSGVSLTADVELQLAVMRGLRPAGAGGGVQQNVQAGLSGGLGIGF
jgi:hypothetical protein